MQSLTKKLWLAYRMNFMEKEDIITVMAMIGDIDGLRKTNSIHARVACAAALGGHLEIIKWCFEHGSSMHGVMEAAAQTGHVSILEWGFQNELMLTQKCLWGALESGTIECLEWLSEHDAPLDAKCYKFIGQDTEKADWLMSKRCYCTKDECYLLIQEFVINENTIMLKWMHDHEVDLEPVIPMAIHHRKDEVILWAIRQSLPISEDDLNMIGGIVSFQTFREMIIHGAPIERVGQIIPQRFAWEGNIEALKWLKMNGVDMRKTLKGAFKGKDQETIKWAFENTPFSKEQVISDAIRYMPLTFLKELLVRGYPLTSQCYRALKKFIIKDRHEKLKWLDENKCPKS